MTPTATEQNAQATRPVTFYTRARALCISPPGMKGELQNIDGKLTRVGEKFIEFSPLGHENYGYFTTSDPEMIAFLNKRIVETGDVFDAKEFLRISTPADIQLGQKDRTIEDQNRLIADLQRQLGAQTTGAVSTARSQK